MIVLCININTRGERMVPTYEGGGGTSTVVGEKLWSNCFGTKNRARRLIFYFVWKLLTCTLGLKHEFTDFWLPNASFSSVELIKSEKMTFGGHLRSTRGRNIAKMTNRKIYHSALLRQGVFGILNRTRSLNFVLYDSLSIELVLAH